MIGPAFADNLPILIRKALVCTVAFVVSALLACFAVGYIIGRLYG